MLYWAQVWKHMHDLTKRDIEKRAVMEFIYYFEEQMNMVISQSVKELDKMNKFCVVQGLKKKHRIDSKCIKQAIKSINNNGHFTMPKRAGGKSPKGKNEKHSQENTEVA